MKFLKTTAIAVITLLSVNLTNVKINTTTSNAPTELSFGTQRADANPGLYFELAGKAFRLAKAKKIHVSTIEKELGWCSDYATMGRAYAQKKGWAYFNTNFNYMYFE